MKIQIQVQDRAWSQLSSKGFLESWGNLYTQCLWATSYQAPGFVCTWFDTYKSIYSPVTIVYENNEGILSGLLILGMSNKNNQLVVAGGNQAEYQCWLATPDCQDGFIVRALADLDRTVPMVGSLIFKYLPKGVPVQPLLESKVISPRIELKAYPCPLMKIELDNIEKSLRKKSNKSRLNRIANFGELGFEKIIDGKTFNSIFDPIIEFYDFRQGATHNSFPFHDDQLKKTFHMNLMERCPNLLHVTATMLDGKPIAAHIGIINRNSVSLAIVANSPFFSEFSVGKMHLIQLAKQIIKDGIPYFDLTPGGDPWKERFANEHDEVYELILYRRAKDKHIAKVKSKGLGILKRMLKQFGITPDRMREIFGLIKQVNLKNGLSKLQFFIPRTVEMRMYCHTLASSERFTSQGRINKDKLADLLKFKPIESWQNKQSFISQALQRIERGEHCFTFASEEALLHYGWLIKEPSELFISEVQQYCQIPENSAFLYDFYTQPLARGMGLYQENIMDIVSDISKLGKVEKIFVSLKSDDRPSRKAIEKLGFAYQGSLYLSQFFGFTKKWRNDK